jgi:hypothetical protein
MLEQWFLDLDGVRSGPYQTSEVMSLIAEGEVLPHHQISTELKSQNWITVLEWRLSQNKTVSKPVEKPEPAINPSTPTPAETIIKSEPEPELESPIALEASPVVAAEIPKIEIEKPETPAVPANNSSTSIPAPTIPPVVPEMKFKSAVIEKTEPSRDPMAEMFDMLQTSKHKREQKSQQQAQTPAQTSPSQSTTSTPVFASSPTPVESSNGALKLALKGALVVIIGFLLGQYFQKLNNKPTSNSSTTSPDPITTKASDNIKPRSTPSEALKELVDRSNEKITIRSRVPTRDSRHEDLQDIRDLKKELLELKALKEEIRNPPENDNSRVESPDRGNAFDPVQPASSPESANGQTEAPLNPEEPAPEKADQDIHY